MRNNTIQHRYSRGCNCRSRGSSHGAEFSTAYSYDAGGNMLYDGRRGLGISYNMLNLPAKVVERNDYYPLGMRASTGIPPRLLDSNNIPINYY